MSAGANTIYEIANEVGVSPATVSRVLNNKPGVKKETREKVLASVKKHNFTLNETARGLVSQSTRTIGILLADLRTTYHTDGIFYIQQELDRLGYCCLIMNTGYDDDEKVRYIQILKQRRVEAAVFIGSNYESEKVKEAIAENLADIPVFITNGYLDLPNVYGIIADEMRGVEECVGLLKKKSCKHIVFINGRHTPSNKRKVQGFLAANEGDESSVIDCGTEYEQILGVMNRLFKTRPDTDGIICVEDPVALMALRILKDRNIDVPGQIKVVGINNSPVAAISVPRLTSLDNMLRDVNLTAARSIVDALQGRYVAKKVLVFSQVVERETT